MANTTVTTLDSVINSEIINDAIAQEARANVVVAPLTDEMNIANESGLVGQFAKLDTLVATAVAEETDITGSAVTPTDIQITASEVGVLVPITDKSIASAKGMMRTLDTYAKACGRAVADKLEGDLTGLFAGLNDGTAVGSTGSDFTDDNFDEARYVLEAQDAQNFGDMVCVLHPRQTSDLRKSWRDGGNSAAFILQEKFIDKKGYQGEYMGVSVFQSSKCPTANTAADVVGAMFIQDYTLGLVTKWLSRLEFDRDASARMTEVVVTSNYGVGEIDDNSGVPIITDA